MFFNQAIQIGAVPRKMPNPYMDDLHINGRHAADTCPNRLKLRHSPCLAGPKVHAKFQVDPTIMKNFSSTSNK